MSRDSAVRAILNSPLHAPPGREFRYSNAAFSMLAMIIEQISGQSYDRFMQERIFGPVAMRHTGYAIAHLDSGLVTRSYTPPVDHGTPAQRLHRAGGPGWNLKGNGGQLTTVDDLYRYDRALEAGRPISMNAVVPRGLDPPVIAVCERRGASKLLGRSSRRSPGVRRRPAGSVRFRCRVTGASGRVVALLVDRREGFARHLRHGVP
ncbi:MAG: serine hydrolase domain-containing protein [Candidatus Eiseniibacteriota bacterium]